MLDLEGSFIRLGEKQEQPKEEKRHSYVTVYRRKKYVIFFLII